jgi:AraC family L-rhamnose operon transcriptional activator RhaR
MTSAPRTLRWDEAFGPVNRIFIERHRLFGDRDIHDHDFMELAIVMGGRSRHESAHGMSRLVRGDAMLLRPGAWHVYRACEALVVVNFCFPFSFARSEWRDLLDARVRRMLRSGDGLVSTRLPGDVVGAIDAMEPLNRGTTGSLAFLAWCLDQFAEAARIPDQALHPAVEKALAAMEDHPEGAWTASGLAKEAALDKAYLSRLFTQQIGVPPITYLAILRAERAALLLRHSDLNCAEVGAASGYSSPELFSKRFRARYGLSPSAYRERSKIRFVDSPRFESEGEAYAFPTAANRSGPP